VTDQMRVLRMRALTNAKLEQNDQQQQLKQQQKLKQQQQLK